MPMLRVVWLSVTKLDLLLFFTFAVLGAHLVVANQEPEEFMELLSLPAYYPAFLGSFLISAGIISILFVTNRYLDLVDPWYLRFGRRIVRQGILVVLVVALSALFAAIYFWVRGTKIEDTSYFQQDFVLIVFMIVSLHGFYSAQYAIQLLVFYFKPALPAVALVENKPVVDVSYGMLIDQIAFIYHIDRASFSVSFENERAFTNGTIEQLADGLPREDYIQIDRDFIISRRVILSVHKASSNRKVCFLNHPFRDDINYVEVHGKKINTVLVTQRNRKTFDTWWKKGI